MDKLRWTTSRNVEAKDLTHPHASTGRKSFNHGSEWARSLCVAGRNDEILVVATGDDRVLLFNLESGEIQGKLSGHKGAVYRMKRFNDDIIVAICGKQLVTWNISECTGISSMNVTANELTAMTIIDNKYVVVGDLDGQIRILAVDENDGTIQKISTVSATHNPLPKDDTKYSLMLKRLGILNDPGDYISMHQRRIWDIASFSYDLVSVGEDSRAVQWTITRFGEGYNEVFNFRRVNEWKHKGPITCAAINANIVVTCGLDEIRLCARNFSMPGSNAAVLPGAQPQWIRRGILSGKHLLTRLSKGIRGVTPYHVFGAHNEKWIHRAYLVDQCLITAGGDGCVSVFRERDLPGSPLLRMDINDTTGENPLGRAVWDMELFGSNKHIAVCGQWYSDAYILDLPNSKGEGSLFKALSDRGSGKRTSLTKTFNS